MELLVKVHHLQDISKLVNSILHINPTNEFPQTKKRNKVSDTPRKSWSHPLASKIAQCSEKIRNTDF